MIFKMIKKKRCDMVSPVFFAGICHRGLHGNGVAENSPEAFKRAVEAGMALELDVHLTADNELAVIHDSDLLRMTGKEGKVEELTVKQLKSDYRLNDGQCIPTLREVMDLVDERVPMTIELKVVDKNYRALARRVWREIRNVRDKKNFMLISFDPRSLMPFHGKGFMRQLLIHNEHAYTFPFRFLFDGIDMEYVLAADWRVRLFRLTHPVNVWTVQDEACFTALLPFTDMVTFQYIDAGNVKDTLNNR